MLPVCLQADNGVYVPNPLMYCNLEAVNGMFQQKASANASPAAGAEDSDVSWNDKKWCVFPFPATADSFPRSSMSQSNAVCEPRFRGHGG